MILPIRTSIYPKRTPYTNYALIAANIAIFVLTYQPHYTLVQGMRVIDPLRPWAEQFMLTPVRPQLWQFLSYAFLHGGTMHIFGNMFFLYLFGNPVNDRLGGLGYLCFYLGGAVFSGLGHAILSSNAVLGASGAVAAVTGAYLVLFPRSLVTVIYWFIFIGSMEVPALYFIAVKLILIDNVIARYTPNVAYDAHLAGYAVGIVVTLGLFATGLLPTGSGELYSMIVQWNRRRRYRNVVAAGYDPFGGMARKKVTSRQVEKPQQPGLERLREMRSLISTRLAEHNLPAAADIYLELLRENSAELLPRQQLLDIANQLASEKKTEEAVAAYEKFLAHYSGYEYAEQVELMLGLMYRRYLDRPEEAARHLKAALNRLTDPDQKAMCLEEINRLEPRGEANGDLDSTAGNG
jgi:membrane associated rhomboid family serine protease